MRKLSITQPDDMIALLDAKVHFDHIEVNLGGYSKVQNSQLQRRIIGLYRPCGCTQTSMAILFCLAVIAVYLFLFGLGEYSAWAFGARSLVGIVLTAGIVKVGVRFWARLQLSDIVKWAVKKPTNVHAPQTRVMTDPPIG